MFTLTMTMWILAHGVGKPVLGETIKHQDTFATRSECEAKANEDLPKIAGILQMVLERKGDGDKISSIDVSCTVAGQEI